MTNTLQFVEIQNEVAMIDSRVYCQDVIMVEHSDWMSNVLYKYQDVIEEHFGAIAFRTVMQDVATSLPSVFKTENGNVTTRYALLTEAQCNFALTLSRNTPEVVVNKAKLIADFESAKQIIRANLERQLTASLQPSAKQNKEISSLKKQVATLETNYKAANDNRKVWLERYKQAQKEVDELEQELEERKREEEEEWSYSHDETKELKKKVAKLKAENQDILHQIKNTVFEHQIKMNKRVKNTDPKIKTLVMNIEITTNGTMPCTYFQDVTVTADTLAKLSEEYRADVPNRTVKSFLNSLMTVKLVVNDVQVPWKLE